MNAVRIVFVVGLLHAMACQLDPEPEPKSQPSPKVVEVQRPEPPPEPEPVFAVDWPRTGVPTCDRLISRYISCDKLPAQSREAFVKGAETWKKALETGGKQARVALSEACEQATEGAKQALRAIGCEL